MATAILLFPFLFNINNGNPRIDIINYLMELCRSTVEEYPEVLPEDDKPGGAHSLCILCFPGNDFTKYCRVHASFPGPEIGGYMGLSPMQQN